ncbi:MAG TPA: hypothetical protein EYP07_13310 [Kiloniellaceae bacterium]|nr:hypothetical protein [Kiloniellaceae bacterium]
MVGITLAQAQAQLDAWVAASTAVARNQAYEIDGRKLTRADARTIRENIEWWDKKVKELSPAASRATVRRGVPRI